MLEKNELVGFLAIGKRHNQHDPGSRVGKAGRNLTIFNAGINGIFFAKTESVFCGSFPC